MARLKAGGITPSTPTPITSVQHKDKRANIPTEELRDFVAAEEQAPSMMLYPRDPSLDPQLVWKGKDEQDREDLAVPVVPIYIQEKIQPQAIIEQVRSEAARGKPDQLSLFSDFDGLDFGEAIEFYRHEQNWANRMVLGDSLMVMTSLAEKEGLKGKVQTIYMDPPYGIKFGSNWQNSTRQRDVKDGKVEDITRQPEQVRAFRDTWTLGIHSYLAYLRDRLVTARELLTETGSVFVQIGDDNVHLVRSLLDEVFGSENYVSLITYSKTSSATTDLLPGTADYILWYAKERESAKYRRLFSEKMTGGQGASKYDQVELADGSRSSMRPGKKEGNNEALRGARPFRLDNLTSQSMGREKGEGSASWFPVTLAGGEFRPNLRSRWKTNESGMQRLISAQRIQVTGNTLAYVRFLDDFPAYQLSNVWSDIGGIQSRADPKIYVVQTSTTAVERCLLMTTDPGDLVLDPTCGSGTTAYVAEQWGRRWITIDTSRVALALARTRLMAAKYPYYLLADSTEGRQKGAQLTGRPLEATQTSSDIKKGFVYKRIPHVTLKSIANNPDIREGMTRQEIEAAIVRYAESETLYDQPYEDSKRIRITGPFTVESLSPHRILPADDDSGANDTQRPAAEKAGAQDAADQYVPMILDNLRKSGVQNTVKQERLKFDRVDVYAGERLQAVGEYTESDGTARRAAICIGPQYSTVTTEIVKQAAKEAVRGLGFDVLIVCGFAFDPYVSEEIKFIGRQQTLIARMNPDMLMGDDLLKKTGAGNLFMVFGEPDIRIDKQADGRIVVTIHGLDIYDPTTGQIRSNSTDDIACWFIDTDYDEESFFVRHAYFTGAGNPYEKLQKALRADIDEDAWSQLYSTISYPFEWPATGKIAVKVINHYGDEVLKVYRVH